MLPEALPPVPKKRPPSNAWNGLTLGVFSRNMSSLFKNQI